tara:strand:+ start:1265 stop:1423 length:159 start_codon:yes stop_codon:yes gene_type:complete
MILSMIGGTLVSTSSDTSQRLVLMVSNHFQSIGMGLKKNETPGTGKTWSHFL